jgi:Cu/Ag efflux protein CusF
MKTNRILQILVATFLACLLANAAFAQQKGKGNSHTLRGKVEGVNERGGSLMVNHEKVEGYMDAMTMAYKVDKPAEVLKKVKVGDQIKATVYDGDYTLYDVEVVPPSSSKK